MVQEKGSAGRPESIAKTTANEWNGGTLSFELHSTSATIDKALGTNNRDSNHENTDEFQVAGEAMTTSIASPERQRDHTRRHDEDTLQTFPSMRARRRANMQGEIGSDDKPKGLIRYIHDSSLEFWLEDRNQNDGIWVPAVYHDGLRPMLIAEWNSKGSYDHPRAHGVSETDITSFLPEQKSWGGQRNNRPKILFQLEKQQPNHNENEGNGVKGFQYGHSKKSFNAHAPREAPIWYHGNRIVLDADNHPVKKYPEIPATCSSEIEGWLMVAIRRSNAHITTQDIRARMPHYRTFKPSGEGDKRQWSLQAHTMRQTRFTMKSASLSWEKRAGSDTFRDYLLSILPQQCKSQNSTEAFRDLDDAEIENMKSSNRGKFMYRGKKRKCNQGDNVPKEHKKQKRESMSGQVRAFEQDNTGRWQHREETKEDVQASAHEDNITRMGKRKHQSLSETTVDHNYDEAQTAKKRKVSRRSSPRGASKTIGNSESQTGQILQLEGQGHTGYLHRETYWRENPETGVQGHFGHMLIPAVQPNLYPLEYTGIETWQTPFSANPGTWHWSRQNDPNEPSGHLVPDHDHDELHAEGNDAPLGQDMELPLPGVLDPALFAAEMGTFVGNAGLESNSPSNSHMSESSRIDNSDNADNETNDSRHVAGSPDEIRVNEVSDLDLPAPSLEELQEAWNSIIAGRVDDPVSPSSLQFMTELPGTTTTAMPIAAFDDVEAQGELPSSAEDAASILDEFFRP